MPNQTQCNQCSHYNKDANVCRKEWRVPAFDGQPCDVFDDVNAPVSSLNVENAQTSNITDNEGRSTANANTNFTHDQDLPPRSNSQLIKDALAFMKGKWGITCAVFLLYYFLMGFLSFFFNAMIGPDGSQELPFINLIFLAIFGFIMPVFVYGLYNSFLISLRNNEALNPVDLFVGFRSLKEFGKVWLQYFITALLIGLFTLLLFIPGVMKAYSLAMVPYIRYDCPAMSITEVLNSSSKMMEGRRFALFKLHLRFFFMYFAAILILGLFGFLGGDMIREENTISMLIIFILGILMFGVILYIAILTFTTQAMFYEDVKKQHQISRI